MFNKEFKIKDGILKKYNGKSDYAKIPDGIIEIDKYAFQNNEYVCTIEIPEGVKVIRNSAFSACTNLKKINIPTSMEVIEDAAFEGCMELDEVHIYDLTSWCKIKFETEFSNPLTQANSLCIFNRHTVELNIPYGVTTINNYAFYGYSALEQLFIPSSVDDIGIGAFSYCNNLKNITVDEKNPTYSSENSNAIINTTAREIVAGCNVTVIPDDIISISEKAFEGCEDLEEITLPESLENIGRYAFANCTKLKNILIPENVIKIGAFAFSDCISFTDITLPENINIIFSGTFSACYNLKAIHLSSNIKDISYDAFDGCDAIKIYAPYGSFAHEFAKLYYLQP